MTFTSIVAKCRECGGPHASQLPLIDTSPVFKVVLEADTPWTVASSPQSEAFPSLPPLS